MFLCEIHVCYIPKQNFYPQNVTYTVFGLEHSVSACSYIEPLIIIIYMLRTITLFGSMFLPPWQSNIIQYTRETV